MTSSSIFTLLAFTALAAASPVDFSRDVQPILSENCYHCHGPDAKAREAKLRLDTKEGMYRTADGITIVKPGDSAGSDLVVRVLSTDKDDMMPPPKSHRTLTEPQKQVLKRWVDEGAPWGEHWAFVAPKKTAAPGITDLRLPLTEWRSGEGGFGDWSANPIDSFILKKLADEKIMPSVEAAPEKLVRRITLDLTGIPPTPEEVDAFVQAATQNRKAAIEGLVDKLLANPRYGERMVWEWLDAARYADTNGYQGDPTRSMWYWRDWAIKAFNENMPFDRFTIEQLGGDLLEKPTHEQLVATGFHRNHMLNGEGGRIAEETRVENVQDRVETTATVWMGLTFNCCRCHDHKFDPITQKEYYQISAFFNSIDETGSNDAGGLANPVISFASAEQQKVIDGLGGAEAKTKKERDELEKKLRAEQPEWEKSLTSGIVEGGTAEPKWTPLIPAEANADQGTVLTIGKDGSVIASGPSPLKDDYLVAYPGTVAGITAFRLEVMTDDSLPKQGPGRAPENGNFVLTELVFQDYGKPIALTAVSADYEQSGLTASKVFDGDQKTGWAVDGATGKPHTMIFTPGSSIGVGGEHTLAFRFSFQYGRQHTLGKLRLSVTTDNPALLQPMPARIRELLVKPAAERSQPEKDELTKYYLDTNTALAAAKKKSDDARTARQNAERSSPRTMVMRERAKPRDTFVLVKGAYDKFADKVTHGVPSILPQLPEGAPSNRLSLAQWLLAPEHPLTARVTVNRFWQQFFGIGLVKTPDDFGVQGEKPSHPELLDWLAVDFRENGWDVKRLVKMMVTSAAYCQSSRVAPGMAERDPENRLLARGPRYRLPSWMLRDQALAVSGLLVEKVGGPPVKGYQPAGVWEDATFGQIKYSQEHGEALYRRSLYTFWRRIVGPTLFFDVSNRQTCSVKTGKTNTPLHALTTLNDVTYVEAARAFAEHLLKSPVPDDGQRIAEAFRRCTGRRPTDAERGVLVASLNRLRQTYTSDLESAKKLIAIGESKPDPKIDPAELAAWTGFGTVLLNLDETLSKE
jgi:hypothetical protein